MYRSEIFAEAPCLWADFWEYIHKSQACGSIDSSVKDIVRNATAELGTNKKEGKTSTTYASCSKD